MTTSKYIEALKPWHKAYAIALLSLAAATARKEKYDEVASWLEEQIQALAAGKDILR